MYTDTEDFQHVSPSMANSVPVRNVTNGLFGVVKFYMDTVFATV